MTRRSLLDDLGPLLSEQVLPAVYRTLSVEPERLLADLRRRGLNVHTLDDLRDVDPDVVDRVAEDVVRSARRMSAVSGIRVRISALENV